MYRTKTTARRDEKHLSFWIWCNLYKTFDGNTWIWQMVPQTSHSLERYGAPILSDLQNMMMTAICRKFYISDTLSMSKYLMEFTFSYIMTWWNYFLNHWPFMRGIHQSSLVTHAKGSVMDFFLCFCPFLWGIHQSPGGSPHKGTVMSTLDFSLLSVWTNCWILYWPVTRGAMTVIWRCRNDVSFVLKLSNKQPISHVLKLPLDSCIQTQQKSKWH